MADIPANVIMDCVWMVVMDGKPPLDVAYNTN